MTPSNNRKRLEEMHLTGVHSSLMSLLIETLDRLDAAETRLVNVQGRVLSLEATATADPRLTQAINALLRTLGEPISDG